MGSSVENILKIRDLKPGMDNISVKVRVLEVSEPELIRTKRGVRTLSRAIVGDETGRIRLTLWGKMAGSIKPGQAIEIRNAWTNTYRGQLVLNVGSRGEIIVLPDGDVVGIEGVPEVFPRIPRTRSRTNPRRRRRRIM